MLFSGGKAARVSGSLSSPLWVRSVPGRSKKRDLEASTGNSLGPEGWNQVPISNLPLQPQLTP